jgi:hypothetical protein
MAALVFSIAVGTAGSVVLEPAGAIVGRLIGAVAGNVIDNKPCPLWVISGSKTHSHRCPLYPRKQTFVGMLGMSAKGQKQTLHRVLPLSVLGQVHKFGLGKKRHSRAFRSHGSLVEGR